MATTDSLRTYTVGDIQNLDALQRYLSVEFRKVSNTLTTIVQALRLLDTTKTNLVNAANDGAAAAAGVPLQGLYHNAGAVRVRLT